VDSLVADTIQKLEATLFLLHRHIQKIQGPLSLGTPTIGSAEVHRGLHKGRRNLRCTFCLSQCTILPERLAVGIVDSRGTDQRSDPTNGSRVIDISDEYTIK
jgi:hypothetical protein